MGSTKLQGPSGSVTLDGGNPTGDFTVTIPAQNATLSSMTLMTYQTASGTSVDFTGIPSWAKRITVMFEGVSVNIAGTILVQLGNATSFVTSAYVGCATGNIGSTAPALSVSAAGFCIYSDTATDVYFGSMTLTNKQNFIWTQTHTFSGNVGRNVQFWGSGAGNAVSDLTRIRITTVSGTAVFDAGTINIMYEG